MIQPIKEGCNRDALGLAIDNWPEWGMIFLLSVYCIAACLIICSQAHGQQNADSARGDRDALALVWLRDNCPGPGMNKYDLAPAAAYMLPIRMDVKFTL